MSCLLLLFHCRTVSCYILTSAVVIQLDKKCVKFRAYVFLLVLARPGGRGDHGEGPGRPGRPWAPWGPSRSPRSPRSPLYWSRCSCSCQLQIIFLSSFSMAQVHVAALHCGRHNFKWQRCIAVGITSIKWQRCIVVGITSSGNVACTDLMRIA